MLRSIVVSNGDLGNEGLELAMPECEGAGPVNGFTLSNQAPCCHLTSSGGDPAVEDKVITRAVATCVGKTRPPIASPLTFVARVWGTLRSLLPQRQVSARQCRRRAVRLSKRLLWRTEAHADSLSFGYPSGC